MPSFECTHLSELGSGQCVLLTLLPLGSRVSPASAQVPLKLFEHFPQVSKAKLVKSLSQLIKENAICISAPCFLVKPAEALSCESELLQRSLAYGHHGNSLQCTTERVKEKESETYRGAPGESHFHREGFQSQLLGCYTGHCFI